MKVSGSDPTRRSRGWKTPQLERREAACPQGHAGTFHQGAKTKMVRQSALRSLTCVRGKGK